MKNHSPQENCENFNSNSPVDTLKTLKDIELKIPGEPKFCYSFDLKTDATKWVKELEKKKESDKEIAIDWIKHFFNLTEGNLQ